MTKEEVQAFLASEEGSSVIGEMGFIPKDQLEKETEGLKNKNKELLEKIVNSKPQKELYGKVKADLDKYNVKDYNEISDLLDRINNPNVPDDVRVLQNDLTRVKAELEKYKNDYELKESEINNVSTDLKKFMVNTQIKQSLLAEGCTDIQADAISNFVLSRTSFDVITDDNGRKAITETGLTPKEFMTQWIKSEDAKALLPAKVSTGSKAQGSGSHQQTVNVGQIIGNAAKQGDTLSAIRAIDSQYRN
jgi:hypothetical protein